MINNEYHSYIVMSTLKYGESDGCDRYRRENIWSAVTVPYRVAVTLFPVFVNRVKGNARRTHGRND